MCAGKGVFWNVDRAYCTKHPGELTPISRYDTYLMHCTRSRGPCDVIHHRAKDKDDNEKERRKILRLGCEVGRTGFLVCRDRISCAGGRFGQWTKLTLPNVALCACKDVRAPRSWADLDRSAQGLVRLREPWADIVTSARTQSMTCDEHVTFAVDSRRKLYPWSLYPWSDERDGCSLAQVRLAGFSPDECMQCVWIDPGENMRALCPKGCRMTPEW